MNRKQRRASGRPGIAGAVPSAAGTAATASAGQLFSAALAHHQTGAVAEAERYYRRVLALDPKHADSLQNLGLIALQAGNAATAVELMSQAIAINDRVAEYHYNAALAFRGINRLDDVAAHLEHAIELRNDHALAHLNLGNVRREQGRLADAAACYERAITLGVDPAPARFNLANVLFEQGQWNAATAVYRQALALAPNHAETHDGLGAALAMQGRFAEAIPHFERAAALKPNASAAQMDLAKGYTLARKPELAVRAARRALELSETEKSKAFFAHCVKDIQFTADDGEFRALLTRALREGWARPRELAHVCLSLIKLNGTVRNAIARVDAAWPTRFTAADLLPFVRAIARDELLRHLLEVDPIIDVGVERLLTNVRYAMLMTADDDSDEELLDFYCAIARQCFINQHVFATVDEETSRAQHLQSSLSAALAAGNSIPALWLAIVAAYVPLHDIDNAELLLHRTWPQSVDDLLTQQVRQPSREREIAAAMPALTRIDDAVSLAVRQQYEQSPYPLWVASGEPPILFEHLPGQISYALIAGCGTGLTTIELARLAPQARILAVDLSLASLSYAARMAQTLGVQTVEFAQADIRQLGSLGRQFDFIDCSGVLHHLADPWQGWRILLSLLCPGGVMRIGLYSELARRSIVAARALIAERGYRPAAEDIRRCRQELMASNDPLLKAVTQWGDFFTTNECRDLLFHVQEHHVALPAIKSFLAGSGLEFRGFFLDAHTHHRFLARFPQPGAALDLDRWHAFETDAPDTFAAMYQFSVRKPEAPRQ